MYASKHVAISTYICMYKVYVANTYIYMYEYVIDELHSIDKRIRHVCIQYRMAQFDEFPVIRQYFPYQNFPFS